MSSKLLSPKNKLKIGYNTFQQVIDEEDGGQFAQLLQKIKAAYEDFVQGTVNNEDAAADSDAIREISDFKLEEDMQGKVETEVLPTDESKISTKPRAETLKSAQKNDLLKDDTDESEPSIELLKQQLAQQKEINEKLQKKEKD